MSKRRVIELTNYLQTYIIDFDTDKISLTKDNILKEIFSIESEVEDKKDERKEERLEDEVIAQGEDEYVPYWVEEKIQKGIFGEKIALSYLKTEYEEVKLVTYDSKIGYDIEVCHNEKILGYEIKTSGSRKGFYITLNELRVAAKKKEDYYILFIYLYPKEKKITGYIFHNPIKIFNIDYERIIRYIELPNAFIMPKQFYIQFKQGFLQELEEISLTKFLK